MSKKITLLVNTCINFNLLSILKSNNIIFRGITLLPAGCLRLWYRMMSSGDDRCSATGATSSPVSLLALRIALLLTSVQNTLSWEKKSSKVDHFKCWGKKGWDILGSCIPRIQWGPVGGPTGAHQWWVYGDYRPEHQYWRVCAVWSPPSKASGLVGLERR